MLHFITILNILNLAHSFTHSQDTSKYTNKKKELNIFYESDIDALPKLTVLDTNQLHLSDHGLSFISSNMLVMDGYFIIGFK